jgi:hypothetical protein
MRLIPAAIGIGVAAWVLTFLRNTDHARKRQVHKEAVTRWEGEGGAIPEVEAGHAPPAYDDNRMAS